MRITGGHLFKNHNLTDLPKQKSFSHIRPTSDSMREALFNVLHHGKFGDYTPPEIEGCNFLDMFCGTGSVGFEALSRGAKIAYFADDNLNSLSLAKQSAEKLRISDKCKFMRCKNTKLRSDGNKFDYVFLDPPYAKGLINPSVSHLVKEGLLNDNCFVITETSKKENFREVKIHKKLEHIFVRDYGNSTINIYVFNNS